MTEERDDKLEPTEDAPTSETGRSEEAPAAAADETTRPVSSEDATSTAASAQSDDDVAGEGVDTDAPSAHETPEPETQAGDGEPTADAEDEGSEVEGEDGPFEDEEFDEERDEELEDEEDEDDEDDEDEPEDEAEAPAAPRRRRGPRRRGAVEPGAEKPAQAAPRRRRTRRDPDLPAPVVRAQAKYVRSSARKARLVCDHIRGKSVEEARAILALTPRAIARDWSKLLESAVANAEHNHELVGEDLYIKAVHADEGPTIKRFRPRAMGRATRIRKRTSHLTILLTPKD
jgi:ribosomal protein L22